MRSVIYFTRELPGGLSEDLNEQGFQVYQALAVSEVLYLCQQDPALVIVIDHTVEPDAANEVPGRHISPFTTDFVRDGVISVQLS